MTLLSRLKYTVRNIQYVTLPFPCFVIFTCLCSVYSVLWVTSRQIEHNKLAPVLEEKQDGDGAALTFTGVRTGYRYP